MPKVQHIDPVEMRKPGFVEFQPIPVNQYQKNNRLLCRHHTIK